MLDIIGATSVAKNIEKAIFRLSNANPRKDIIYSIDLEVFVIFTIKLFLGHFKFSKLDPSSFHLRIRVVVSFVISFHYNSARPVFSVPSKTVWLL